MDKSRGFGFYLDRTLKKIITVYLKHFKENGVDLTIEQWVILQRIYELGNKASQVEISKLSYRNRATTSRVISGLCKKGLVIKERFEGDQKRFKLVITPEGKKLVKKLLPGVAELREAGFDNISDKEYKVFFDVLDKVWANYEKFET